MYLHNTFDNYEIQNRRFRKPFIELSIKLTQCYSAQLNFIFRSTEKLINIFYFLYFYY